MKTSLSPLCIPDLLSWGLTQGLGLPLRAPGGVLTGALPMLLWEASRQRAGGPRAGAAVTHGWTGLVSRKPSWSKGS